MSSFNGAYRAAGQLTLVVEQGQAELLAVAGDEQEIGDVLLAVGELVVFSLEFYDVVH